MAKLTDKATKPHRSLADFFANSPLRNSGLSVEREKCPPRDIDFDDTIGEEHKTDQAK